MGGDRQDRERAHTLRAVDENAFDVRGGGWASMEGGIAPVAKLGTAICMVKVDDDIGGVEQHDEMLREVGHRVHLQDVCVGGCGTSRCFPHALRPL